MSYLSELTVHTWDLATATGQSPAWHPSVLEAAYDAIHRGLPAEDRKAMFDKVAQAMPPELRGGTPPFGEAVPVAPDASVLDRLIAWTGRQPGDHHGLVQQMASSGHRVQAQNAR